MNISTIGMGIVVGMALIHDTSGTLKLISVAGGTVGATWLAKKVIGNINTNASQVIEFAGWSIAGVSIVRIIANAMRSIDELKMFFNNVGLHLLK